MTVGIHPVAAALNTSTGKLYIANLCGTDPACLSNGTVTVIDSSSDTVSTLALAVGKLPGAIAVNAVTNKVYVANKNSNNVSVIDGSTNTVNSIAVGTYPYALAINTTTNRVYVVNMTAGTVAVIDGSSGSVIANIAVGSYPFGIALNEQTNRVYVSNMSSNTVTVIDGSNNAVVATVPTGTSPQAIAVNAAADQVYVANFDATGTITVIDGKSNATATAPAGQFPAALLVNSSGSKIYAADEVASGQLGIVDGASLGLTSIGVGKYPLALAADSSFQSVYVANSNDNTVSIVDGTTNATSSIQVGSAPRGIVVNSATGEAYVLNYSSNSVSVITGASVPPPPPDPPDPPSSGGLRFVAVTPCRIADTRKATGSFGGPSISSNSTRNFPIPLSSCGIPASAAAYSLNVTVVPQGPLGYVTVWPTGPAMPKASTLNSLDGRVKANAAIIAAGTDANGSVSVFATNTTDVVLDINGYFTNDSSALLFYPVAPCRVVDTRKATMGAPSMASNETRSFTIRSTTCKIPSTAQAYSLNVTAVPQGPLGYISVWPSDEAKPVVSTLNAVTGTIVANAAIVPGSTVDGTIDIFATNPTDLVIDVNGYFAGADSPAQGLSLYGMNVCRILDTRSGSGAPNGTLKVNQSAGACPSVSAQALVMNATAIPSSPLGYLSLWPDGTTQPTVSTLNSLDGAITSNMAIVPMQNGNIDAFTSNPAQLVLDMSGYFAP